MGDECNPCVKVLLGLALFFLTVFLTGWNEGRTVEEDCKVAEIKSNLKLVKCEMDPANDGELVYLSCPLAENIGTDFNHPEWGVTARGLEFSMNVEQRVIQETENCPPTFSPTRAPTMPTRSPTRTPTRQPTNRQMNGRRLQQLQTQAPTGQPTEVPYVCTYTYKAVWMKPGPGQNFRNPSYQTTAAYTSLLGDLSANPSGAGSWGDSSMTSSVKEVELGKGYSYKASDIPTSMKTTIDVVPSNTDLGTFESWVESNTPPSSLIKAAGKSNLRWEAAIKKYVSYASGAAAIVGDVQVGFKVKKASSDAMFSYVGKQEKSTSSDLRKFGTYTFPKCGDDVTVSAQTSQGQTAEKIKSELIDDLESANSVLAMVFRIMGFLGLWLAFWLLVSPLEAMGDMIGNVPCVGDMIEGLVDTLLLCFTCLCGAIWFLLVFAASWMYFRPMIGIPVFVGALLLIGGLVYWRISEKKKRQGATVPAGAAVPGAVVIPVQPGQPGAPGVPMQPMQPGVPAPVPQPGFAAPPQPGFPAPAPQPGYPAPAPAPAAVTPEDKLFNFMQGKSGAPPGHVSWTEFKQMCASVGWQEQDAMNMWYATDTDRNNLLGQAEFMVYARQPTVYPHVVNMANGLP